MILTAHQIGFLPWLGFFDKLARCDTFCVFDAVQYERRGWTNRNQIKTANGTLMLSVPVASKDHFNKRLCDVEVLNGNWARKHMRSIELAYSKAPHFEQHYAGVGAVIDLYAEGGLLCDLNLDLMRYFMRALGLQKPIVRASDYAFNGVKSDLVLDMCLKLKADSYIFGGEGKNYADAEGFRNAGVEPVFQQYVHPEYRQQHGPFIPNLSVVDLLMNEGPESLNILRGANGQHLSRPAAV